ncbi:MAG: acyltransferase family protein [Actinomycetota bacterium]|jgi:peptidoglycan/LPS O-acetylase OafA/YrhL/lysophospholipase L1-like esterase|nr:acyltransferase family protein [Actinomycetota bacterium]
MTDGLTTSFVHVPSLDGLRGVAVASVVVYHLWPAVLPGGFIGVDVFFVLSGFLLTSLLVREVDATGKIRLGRFFVRRTRRLLPAMLLMLTTLAIYAAAWANTVELERLRRHGLAALLYAANWLFISDGTTYTDVVAGVSPLRHVWSLSIEEQFYVMLAGAIALAAAFTATRRYVIVGSVVLGAVSALWMIILSINGSSVDRLYFGADTRAQALLIGAALGATLRGVPVAGSRRTSAVALLSVAVLIVVSATASESSTWMYRGGFALTALAAGMVIVGAPATPWIRQALEWRPLRLLGIISYGVYLWHWPVLVILDEARLGLDGSAHRLVVLAVTLIVATLSYRLVERPIRQGALGDRLGPRSIAVGPAFTAAVAAALIIATVGPATLGAADSEPTVEIGATIVFEDPRPTLALADTAETASPTTSTVPTATSGSVITTSSTVLNRLPGPTRVAVVGDSVMHTMIGGRLLSDLQFEPWTVADTVFDTDRIQIHNVARPLCSFLPGDIAFEQFDGSYESVSLAQFCGDWRSDLRDAIERGTDPVDIVMVLLTNDLEDRRVDESILTLGSAEHTSLLIDFVDEVRAQTAAVDAALVLLVPAPRLEIGTTDAMWDREARVRTVFESYASTHSDVSIIDAGRVLCPAGNCAEPLGNFDPIWRYDGLHFNRSGAIWMANWLTPQLEEIAAYS